MRELLTTFANPLLSADADAVCGTTSPDRVASRNGYRHRDPDTRVGTRDVAIPKLRAGTYFPDRDSVIRLVGAVLAEQHDELTEGRSYLGLDVMARSRLTLLTTHSEQTVKQTAATGQATGQVAVA